MNPENDKGVMMSWDKNVMNGTNTDKMSAFSVI